MIDRFSDSDADYDGYVALKRRVWTQEVVSPSTQRAADARLDPTEFNERLVIRDGDEMVAAADVYSLPYSGHGERFGFMVIVDPVSRRQGLGTALYDYIANDIGLGRVGGWETASWEGDPSGSAWLEHLGFGLAGTHQMSELDLASADTSSFAPVVESVEASGVELLTLAEFTDRFSNSVPDLYDLAVELSNDAPWYEEVSKPPLETWRLEYIDSELILDRAFTVAVLDGRLIGQTALMRDAHDDQILRTGLTGVRSEFRRRHIAAAMKVKALNRVGALMDPDVDYRVRTGNAAENPMLDLNLKLGFVKQPAWFIYSKTLFESPV